MNESLEIRDTSSCTSTFLSPTYSEKNRHSSPSIPLPDIHVPQHSRSERNPDSNSFHNSQVPQPKNPNPPDSPTPTPLKREHHTNIWSVPPEFIQRLESTIWPSHVSFVWGDHIYPVDYMVRVDDTRDVFRRTTLNESYILNPPYDPYYNKDGKIISLEDHILHLMACSRKSFRPTILVLPLRPTSRWFRFLQSQPDVIIVTLKKRLSFLRGRERSSRGLAPFLSILVFIGAKGHSITVKNDTSKWRFPSKWVQSVKWTYLPTFPFPSSSLRNVFSSWKDFVARSIQLTTERKKQTKRLDLPNFEPVIHGVTHDLFLLCSPERSAFDVLREHADLCTPEPFITLGARDVEPFRLRHIHVKTSTTPHRCHHCNENSHDTSECWRSFHQNTTDIKSPRMRWLITRVLNTKNTLNWSPPPLPRVNGQNLLLLSLPSFLQKAENTRCRLLQECPFDLRGMCDSQFSRLPFRVHVWLTAGLPRAMAQQLLTGFVPRWRGKIPPRFLVQRSTTLKKANLTLQEQDLKHEVANRIIRIPATEVHKFVHNTCPRFPIWQEQFDKTQKLRVIFDARYINEHLPRRHMTLPSLWKIKQEFRGWIFSMDLTKAYAQVPMSFQDRKYFAAQFGTDEDYFLYQWWPFGVCSSPSICQTLFSTVVRLIRRITGWFVILYLDDFLLRISTRNDISREEAMQRVEFVLSIFEALGLFINAKSQLIPAKEILWLGAYVNTDRHDFYGTEVKFEKFAALVMTLVNKKEVPINELQELLGLFNFLNRSSKARFLCRPLELTINTALVDFGEPLTSERDFKRFGRYVTTLPPYLNDLMKFWGSDLIDGLGPPTHLPGFESHLLDVSDASEQLGGFFVFSPLDTLPQRTLLDTNQLVPDIDVTLCESEHFLTLPREVRVTRLHSAMLKPSSFIRELYVVMKTVQHARRVHAISNEHSRICIHILTDNQGLARAFPHIKTKSPWELAVISQTLWELPSKWHIQLHWHPRDSPLATRADTLSKIGDLRITKAGLNHIHHIIKEPLHISMSHGTLVLTHDGWARSRYQTRQLFLIHPLLLPCEQVRILQSLQRFSTSGFVLVSHLPAGLTSPHFLFTQSPHVQCSYETQQKVPRCQCIKR